MKVHPWNFFFLLGIFFVSVFLFVYTNDFPKECFFSFFFVSLLIISGTQNEIYFVRKRVKEHGDLKWQLDFVKIEKEKHTKQEENKMEK